MSVGMVPLPAPPVRAPSANSCPSTTKPFACHTSEKSLKSSTSSDAAFFCRHPPSKPLCVTSLQEWRGGEGGFPYQFFIPFQFSELAGGFLPPEACRPKIWLCYT